MQRVDLELAKELYELSGWGDLGTATPIDEWLDYSDEWSVPAYDLGYLLRKLPSPIVDDEDEFYLEMSKNANDEYSFMYSNGYANICGSPSVETPENTLCQLASELFRQNILKRDDGGSDK